MFPKPDDLANTNDVWMDKGKLTRPGLYTKVCHSPAPQPCCFPVCTEPLRLLSGHQCVPYHPLSKQAGLGPWLQCVKDVHTAGSGLVQQASAHSNRPISQLYSSQPGNCIKHLAPAQQDHLPVCGDDTCLSLNMAGCGYSHSTCTAARQSFHSTRFPHVCKRTSVATDTSFK